MKIQSLSNIRYEAFKNQDLGIGAFDVVFDIGGKKLYSNKFMLLPVSTTFASMISIRWNTTDQPIPIDTYSHEDFYQFLTFLYTGECHLNNDNIFTMVDIAEFFQVADFKDFCEEFLATLQCTLENVIQLLETAAKYSLDKLKKSLVSFIQFNHPEILNPDSYLRISKEVILQIISACLHSQQMFSKVYEWAEKQTMAKMESDSNIVNLDEAVKELLADFLPLFDFGKMDQNFVIEFVVGKALLPPGPELCAILKECCNKASTDLTNALCEVTITDKEGRTMKGRFCDPGKIYDKIEKLKLHLGFPYAKSYIYWEVSCEYRPSQNILKKRVGVKWYLVLDGVNNVALKNQTEIRDANYLIAEMFPQNGYILGEGIKISIVRL